MTNETFADQLRPENPQIDPSLETSHMVGEAIQQGAEIIEEPGDEPYLLGTIRWPLPSDLPYAYVEYDVSVDLSFAMQRTSNIIAAMRKVRDANQIPSQAPQNVAQPPVQGNAVGQPIQGVPAQSGGIQGEQFYCAQHRVPVRESSAQYQKYDEVNGMQVPARYFHRLDQPYIDAQTNKQVNNHSLWRRELVHQDGTPVEAGTGGA